MFFTEAENNPTKRFRSGVTVDMCIASYINFCLTAEMTPKNYKLMSDRKDDVLGFLEMAIMGDEETRELWEPIQYWIIENLE